MKGLCCQDSIHMNTSSVDRSGWSLKKRTEFRRLRFMARKRKTLHDRCEAVAALVNDSPDQWAIWCGLLITERTS